LRRGGGVWGESALATASRVLRASWVMFYARQNRLTEVGKHHTNGVQQQAFAAGSLVDPATCRRGRA